jgi:hypothetical protein
MAFFSPIALTDSSDTGNPCLSISWDKTAAGQEYNHVLAIVLLHIA